MKRSHPPAGGPTKHLACLLAAVIAAGCAEEGIVRDVGTRAVVIGIDSADWTIIDALAADGGMPNLARLKQRAAWGKIETLHDIPLSPVVWTSVATGKTAAKHGISWFMVDQPDGTRVPIRSHNRKARAIWNILAEHDRRPMVLGWWATFPAEDVGDGTIVSDALGFHGFGATARDGDDAKKTHPPELFARVDPLVPPEQQLSHEFVSRFVHITPEDYRAEMYDPARHPAHNPLNPIHLFQQYAVTAQGYTAIAEDLLEKERYDLFMVYFEQVDSFSHLFMKYAPPRLPWIEDDAAVARYQDVVYEWYRYQDELLGRLLDKIDLDDTAVFIVSDHGFKSGDRRIRSEQTVDARRAHLDHETHGIFLAAGPHIRRGVEVQGASVLDLTPTVLHYLGFPVAKDMDGKVLENVFKDGFAGEQGIRYVSTYEPGDDVRVAETGAQSKDFSAAESDKAMAALRSLGYVGDAPSEGAAETAPGDASQASGGGSSPEVHNNLGRIHLRDGELDKARSEFEKALELDPRNADALLNLSSIHAAEGRIGAAEHLVKRALQVDPNSIGALAQLGEDPGAGAQPHRRPRRDRARQGQPERGRAPVRGSPGDRRRFAIPAPGLRRRAAAGGPARGRRACLQERARARSRLVQGALQPGRDLRQPGPGRRCHRDVQRSPRGRAQAPRGDAGAQQPGSDPPRTR